MQASHNGINRCKVFETLMGPSSGPNIKLFQRFFENWNSIDQSNYESGPAVDIIASTLAPVRHDLIDFIQHQLTQFHPRDDYRQLLQPSFIFLGAESSKGIHIQAPEACHRARWMAKLIYSLKIFLFRSQFKLTERELSSLSHFNTIVLMVHLKSWFTAPCTSSAPEERFATSQRVTKLQENKQ